VAYAYYRQITIDHAQVPGDLSDFPVLVEATVDSFKSVANGGHVENSTTGGNSGSVSVPADLVFAENNDGSDPLDFEIERWDETTGHLVAWVLLPTVSSATDTIFYVCYGDPAVTTSQENVHGVWAAYRAVYHFDESSGTRYDSTANGNDLNDPNSAPRGDGIIAGCTDLEASSHHYHAAPDAASLDISSSFTIECWINLSTAGRFNQIVNKKSAAVSDDYANYGLRVRSDDKPALHFGYGTGTRFIQSPDALSASQWYQIVGVYNDGANYLKIYVSGQEKNTVTGVTQTPYVSNYDLWVGLHRSASGTDSYSDGKIDELRISATAIGPNKILASYRNATDPGFLTLSPEQTPELYPVRLTQELIEVETEIYPPELRITQALAEVEEKIYPPELRITQALVETEFFPDLPPTECSARYDCYSDCVMIAWADPSSASDLTGIQIQKKSGPHWTTIAVVSLGQGYYQDCDTDPGGVYIYRLAAVYIGGYLSSWCTTGEVRIPPYFTVPVTWTPTVLIPSYQIFLKDQDGVVVAVFDNWLSLEYVKKTRDYGYYKLTLQADDPRLELFELDGQVEVWRRWPGGAWYKDFEGFHRQGRWWMDRNDIERFESSGVGYEHLLWRRIVIPEFPMDVAIYADELTDIMRQIVREHCASEAAAARRLQGLSVEADDNTGPAIYQEFKHVKVLKALQDLTAEGGDFEIVGTGPAAFEFRAHWPYRGLDKTITQTDHPPVHFAVRYGNLAMPDVTESWNKATSWVLVGGKGEGVMRRFVERENTTLSAMSPWGRIEDFKDARSEDTEEGLQLHGDIYLAEHDRELKFSCQALQIPACYYGRDWGLGDVVSAQYRGRLFGLLVEEVHVRVTPEGERMEQISPTFALLWEQEVEDYYP